MLEPLAASETVLKPDERRMGVAVVDMGGGTSDLAIFSASGLCHTVILDMGGNHLTNDLAVGIHCSFETAEDLKLRYGWLPSEWWPPDETVWAPVFGEKAERSFSRRFSVRRLEGARREMMELVATGLEESGYAEHLPAGVVLTGGCQPVTGLRRTRAAGVGDAGTHWCAAANPAL